ncbi:MAG: hypothetical protein J6R79_04445 [Bacteroidaceae bacterium]|nr:hypothetical protein [Bacteroidaceae bacterium]
MSRLKFKCTLLSDVILNQNSASEGANQTLDFIPGSNFLGIAASTLYIDVDAESWEIFHSGNVRFGDAHPSLVDSKFRGLKTPASFFYPKLSHPSEKLYVHHKIPNVSDVELKKEQLKQCRSGFCDFSKEKAVLVQTNTNFAIKSAYDKVYRRSKDEQMYGYESLQKDLVLYFEVEVLNEALVDKVRDSLVGKKRIGRSRTAQYGLVDIEVCEYEEVCSNPACGSYVEVYADSRLIFLDEYGLPTFQPKAEDLGLKGEVCKELSQIRTFQYAPWNYKRQCFDTDRCGIEKGSVFVVKTDACPAQSQYVGAYNNEGFGKVIYNPMFFKADEKGIAKVALVEAVTKKAQSVALLSGSPLLTYLSKKKEEECVESQVYKRVNEWVEKNKKIFTDFSFASQWGQIRSIAMKCKTKGDLYQELFEKHTTLKGKPFNAAYLGHGVAEDKWRERGRLGKFKEFFENMSEENVQIAVINLASEMQKKCKEKE